jgi:sulfur carrier protein ThiS
MKVTLKLAGGFVHTVGFSQKELDVEPGTTVAEILASIAIDRGRPMIIARNGHGASAEDEVRAGDRILVSPIFSGG